MYTYYLLLRSHPLQFMQICTKRLKNGRSKHLPVTVAKLGFIKAIAINTYQPCLKNRRLRTILRPIVY